MKQNILIILLLIMVIPPLYSGRTKSVVDSFIVGADRQYRASVEQIAGKGYLLTNTNISSVNVPNGRDPIPDTFFKFTNAGAIGDTVRIQIAGITDPTSSERSLPAVDYTYTLIAADVDNEEILADNFNDGLNADTDFINAYLDSDTIIDGARAIIHISSKKFSLSGEWYERPNANDVLVTVTGTTTIQIDSANTKLISRAKETSFARDPNNPHDLGILGISGSVQVTPGSLANRFIKRFLDGSGSGASRYMNIDGSVTPVEFCVWADQSGEFDELIQKISIHGSDNGIKFQKFLGQNSILTNGIMPTIITEGNPITLFKIQSTDDLKHEFTLGDVINFQLHITAAVDDVVATATFNPPFTLIAGSGDKVCLLIQDNLLNVSHLETIAVGFKREAN